MSGIGFSTILNAVSPRDRTDQYVILAAMYDLNAAVNSVTATDIRGLLKLHLGRKLPTNISAALRKYGAYVEPAESGPPLRWRLKPLGLERLRNISDLSLPLIAAEIDYGCDVGIVCALENTEFDAVRDAFGGAAVWTEIGETRYTHVYRETKLETASGKSLRIVATTSTSMGLTAAAIATTQLIMQFRPRLVMMIGIAAGTRSGNKQCEDFHGRSWLGRGLSRPHGEERPGGRVSNHEGG
jgi:hypothetical protein